MAVIDTLKLARALHDKAGFSQEAADATAEAINAALGEDVATKSDIKLLDGKITLLPWAVGTNVAATVTIQTRRSGVRCHNRITRTTSAIARLGFAPG